ncbi:hypothetical protein UPYG_G00306940 [Umbra pygmaea]|uniref:BED-type domain-containing protein n=1 Tax=Umbra pygmaea TaxID=75934 RepID=A0ABD0WGV9_UMBPY
MESRIGDRKKYRSHTWRYFNEVGIENVTCKLCGAVLKRSSGSTTSMLNHLERIHYLSLRHIKTRQEFTDTDRGKTHLLNYNRTAIVKIEKELPKSTKGVEEGEEPHPKAETSGHSDSATQVALTEELAAEPFEFQYGLEGPTFQSGNGESSKSHLSIIKVEQLDPLPEQTDTSCCSGSPVDSGPPGSSGSGSGSVLSPAAEFFGKCHQAGCTQFIFSEFASRLSAITERITSQQASEEELNLTLKVLEASGMLQDIFAKRDQEMEERLRELHKESETLMAARSAIRDACAMSLTSS